MKDIDFDELDKAVNSLIGSRPQGAVVQDEATVNAVVEPVASAPAASPVVVSNSISDPVSEKDVVAKELPKDVVAEKTAPTPKYVPVYYPARPRPLITTPINPPKPMPVNTFESLASKRSSGKFVDVVNPSANVQMSSKVELVPTPVIAQPPVQVLNPTEPIANDPAPIATVQTQMPQPTVAVMSPTPQVVSPQAPVITSSRTPVAPINPVDEDDDIEQISNFINETMSSNSVSNKTQESPFIIDSKVEKRPLGSSPAAVVSQVAPSVQPIAPPVVPVQQQTPVHFQSSNFGQMNSQLPPELQNDLLSIESDAMPAVDPLKTINIPPVMQGSVGPQEQLSNTAPIMPVGQIQTNNISQAVDASQNMTVSQQQVQPIPTITIAPIISPSQQVNMQNQTPVLQSNGFQASIPQQYPSRPNVVDHTPTPIYDTNAYHKIDTKSAKKSPLMWVFWMLGLVVIGAGVGVVAYFFILPNL